MSEPMVRVIRGGLVRLIHYSQLSKSIRSPLSSSNPNYVFASSVRAYSSSLSPVNSRTSMISQFHSRPTSSNAVNPNTSSLSTRSLLFFTIKPAHSPISGAGFGVRLFSMNSNLGKRVFWDKPATALTSTFSRYREAIGLQIEAFFRRNSLILIGAGGLLVCALLWRIMFGIANTFVGLSEGMAKYGFLALSSAIVAFAGLYLRSRSTVNPDKIYRMAMRRLNTSAGILEVMGAPLTGTDLRAYVMSGGGLTLKNLRPHFRSKRCFLIFPVQGSERKGLVSVEVKNKKGQYDLKLLAVDIPMASGPDQRLFLIGDEEEYKVGGGLISELRDPVVKAMAASKEFDDLDQIEEEEDAERERQEGERRHQEEIEKLEKGGSH
ncbi:uncharacterized protein LOC121255676 [Juglans microcarpa x Juglans regia]|uniref:uncharacterized protein LOC121255676 n=1 Tax=Juglans microcarpa x Juglans regia TaxID=2249226 RepID=UPI001B7E8B7A|nr:uncharacterized protein LOC121255676 [Juglans microcarpa x Juglans regia]